MLYGMGEVLQLCPSIRVVLQKSRVPLLQPGYELHYSEGVWRSILITLLADVVL